MIPLFPHIKEIMAKYREDLERNSLMNSFRIYGGLKETNGYVMASNSDVPIIQIPSLRSQYTKTHKCSVAQSNLISVVMILSSNLV